MDEVQLIEAVRKLAASARLPFSDGRALRLIDDHRLAWGSGREADVLVAQFPAEAAGAPLALSARKIVGPAPARMLFVDVGSVLAGPRGTPRHP